MQTRYDEFLVASFGYSLLTDSDIAPPGANARKCLQANSVAGVSSAISDDLSNLSGFFEDPLQLLQ